jgi:multidrug efflux system membrane fusion protein
VLLAVVALAASAIFLTIHKSSVAASPPAAAMPTPVTTTSVQQEDMSVYVSGIGTVQANKTVTVKARVDGQLEKIGFTEGQDVTEGQLIAQLDRRPFVAQLEQYEAQKARDLAQLANAKLDLERYNVLITQDAVTQQTFDTQKTLLQQVEAAIKTDEAQIAYAKVQLDYTTITAPLSGRIGARLIDQGNIVHATDNTGLVVINQVDPIAVVFTIPEESFQDINRAMQQQTQPLAVYAYARIGDKLLSQGELVLLNNQLDTTTGTVQLKGIFKNASHVLWPGQYVNVRLVLGKRNQALTIPAMAIQRSQTGPYVYAVKADDTVRLQPVQVAQVQEGKAIIAKGLNVGDHIVLDGQYRLKPGARIIEAPAAPGGPQPAKASPPTVAAKGDGN